MDSRCVVAGVLMMATVGGYPALAQSEPGQLAVEISAVNATQGQVCLNLFNSSNGFPGDREAAVETLCIALAEDVPLVATFEDLTPGSYAVSVFHDANSDNEFNRNFVGMPTEGFGFSRNPRALTGPPEFGDAVVLVAGAETRIEVELSYF
ncbi:MAG: DUF2141 domain-containing protein [Cyanobacteria bacterium P01_H01_bin.105]